MRLIRSLLLENLVLALVSGALGSALAAAILRMVASVFAAEQPAIAASLAVDVRLLPVALGSSALACLLLGAVPALRLSKRDVAASLNGVPAVHRIEIAGYGARDVIVFAETAAAVGFIVWTAMLYTLFSQVSGIKTTFPADRVVAMRVPAATVRDVAARVAAVPGMERTTTSSGMLGGGSRERVEAAGLPATVISRLPVGADFFGTLGLPLTRGRSFDAAELEGRATVAVLSESAAARLAPGRDPLGIHLRVGDRDDEVVVIGVSRDAFDYGALGSFRDFTPEVYVPYEPSPTSSEAVVLARTSGDPHAALRAIAAAAGTPPGVRPARPVVLTEEMNARVPATAMTVMRLLASFAIVTLLLAASGVFAVIGQSVAQRTREFGIRLALGATPSSVLRMVLARETKLIGAAVATGVIFTMLTTRALFLELARLSATLPSMWVWALVLAGAVAAAAVMLATYRIVRLEPATVLRRL